ncbi:MAG: RidA family protein [bacterium]|jgi:2-iminobutanoate/2-iminopropanoate deaminase
MGKKLISPQDGPAPVGPYSPGVVANGFVFVSGQIPLHPETGQIITSNFDAQVRQVIENMRSVLKAAGADLDDVVKVTIFLSDLSNFERLNEIYSEYFGQSKPARTTVQAARLPKNVDVEMDAIAVVQN